MSHTRNKKLNTLFFVVGTDTFFLSWIYLDILIPTRFKTFPPGFCYVKSSIEERVFRFSDFNNGSSSKGIPEILSKRFSTSLSCTYKLTDYDGD